MTVVVVFFLFQSIKTMKVENKINWKTENETQVKTEL